MYPVEVLHESSPKVFKIITVMQEKGLVVIIDRRCLFAYDFMNGICVGSPQPAGIKCPCCNKTQEQVDLEHDSGRKDKVWKRSQHMDNQGFVAMELGELD